VGALWPGGVPWLSFLTEEIFLSRFVTSHGWVRRIFLRGTLLLTRASPIRRHDLPTNQGAREF